ncbi:MAG: HEAT repeat domain-containing protein [Bryobacteraceae bacterium]
MNCDLVTKLIPLYFYGELSPEEEDRIEQHFDACTSCAREAEWERSLAVALDRRRQEPSGSFVADCRQDLMRAVYRDEPRLTPAPYSSPWDHFRNGFAALFPPLLRWRTPLSAAALVALGFFSARFTTPGGAVAPAAASLTPESAISSVRSIQPTPAGGVQIVLDETRRRVVSGPLDDSNIQRLMLVAAHDETNPGVRVESVDILKSHSDSSEVRNLLLNRLVQDPNPGVRLQAIEGLQAFTAEPDVRKVMAQVLLQDDNPAVRIQAVNALTSHTDDNMVGLLQNVVQKEDNTYVRRRCEKALKDMNASIGTF